ncbi:MAG: sigma-E processing peptidase SpoIIGA, partial [Acutalibacteraceae bacterium]
IFFAMNFAFAGLMFAINYFIAPKKMVYNNGIVYFNIDALTLAVLTIICYLTIKLIHKIAVFKSPVNTLYEIDFICFGNLFSCRAFLDTGNSLKEPFSSLPVIIVYENLNSKNDNNITLKMIAEQNEDKARLIPCAAVSSDSLLKGYKITDVHIKGIDIDFNCSELYAALIGRKIHGGDFGALLTPEVFKSNTKETEGDYV